MKTNYLTIIALSLISFSSIGQIEPSKYGPNYPIDSDNQTNITTCRHTQQGGYTPPSFPQPPAKTILTNPQLIIQSIHNVIAKWDAGSVYRFDFGTTPGGDDIYNGHLLWNTDKHTIGHSFKELQNYAIAQ